MNITKWLHEWKQRDTNRKQTLFSKGSTWIGKESSHNPKEILIPIGDNLYFSLFLYLLITSPFYLFLLIA